MQYESIYRTGRPSVYCANIAALVQARWCQHLVFLDRFFVNRSFSSFLLFLVALGVLAAGGVWWLGVDVVKLALDDERRSAPYQLLHFADADVPRGGYAATLTGLVQLEEGGLQWRGGLERLLEGRTEDEWPDLMMFGLPQGADLVQMITSPEFRELEGDRRVLLLGMSTAPVDLNRTTTLLVWLQARPDDVEGVGGDGAMLSEVTRNLPAFSGSVLVEGPVDRITGPVVWSHVALLAFPDEAQAQAWFREPVSVTERTLATKHLDRQAWLLMSAKYLRQSS